MISLARIYLNICGIVKKFIEELFRARGNISDLRIQTLYESSLQTAAICVRLTGDTQTLYTNTLKTQIKTIKTSVVVSVKKYSVYIQDWESMASNPGHIHCHCSLLIVIYYYDQKKHHGWYNMGFFHSKVLYY